ncbi:TetR/AcrR family transcriptional regulator [Clostridium sp. DL1XJH146]
MRFIKKSEITKEKIISKSIEIISEKGYSATSTREIAKEAGVSEATIFKYFNTKEELLNKVVVNIIREFKRYTLEDSFPKLFKDIKDKNGDEQLIAIIKERYGFLKTNMVTLKIILHEMFINEDVENIFKKEIWGNMEAILDGVLDKGKKEKIFRDDLDNKSITTTILGMLFSTLVFADITNVSNVSLIDTFLGILLEGIRSN